MVEKKVEKVEEPAAPALTEDEKNEAVRTAAKEQAAAIRNGTA